MALYERYEDGRKVERAFTVDGDARDLEFRALVGLHGWKHIDEAALTAPPAAPVRPAQAATKAEWVAWAVAQGADPDEADAATKADLVAAYGKPASDGEE